MAYQVLARRWRPRNFSELVGQEHVVRPLINALNEQRLHHAFLFAGTRGVGKTTIARIFAKALNCEQGISAEPCGQCSTCIAINEGNYVDLIEVDAASRTKVEDTRELLDNVQYAPTRGRFKVYLIDEVHMLSNHSFNALLKTLEEPPPYVKFLLATTDPQKLPVTVLSRCLQFKLKRLSSSLIATQLTTIINHENISFEPAALQLIAQAGEGSMRDALSLLDQAIANGGGNVVEAEVAAMLGLLGQGHIVNLLAKLVDQDAKGLLDCIADLDQDAPDYSALLAQLLSYLQRIALSQVVPGLVDDSIADPAALQRLAQLLSPEDVQLYYQIALTGRRDLPLVPEPRSGFEMLMLRMLCFTLSETDAAGGATSVTPGAVKSTPIPASAPAPIATPIATPIVTPAKPEPEPAPAVPAPLPTSTSKEDVDWNHLVAALPLRGIVQQLAIHCAFAGFDGKNLQLNLDPAHVKMRTSNTEQRLQTALEEHFSQPIKLIINVADAADSTPAQVQAEQWEARRQEAVATIQQDPNIQALKERFNARLNIDSIQPTD